MPSGAASAHVQVLNVATSGISHTRTLVLVGEGAEVQVSQGYCSVRQGGGGPAFTNGVTRVIAGTAVATALPMASASHSAHLRALACVLSVWGLQALAPR